MNRKNILNAFGITLVIGTALNLINSYDVLAEGKFTNRNVIRIVLTYITPFCVSLYSAIRAARQTQA